MGKEQCSANPTVPRRCWEENIAVAMRPAKRMEDILSYFLFFSFSNMNRGTDGQKDVYRDKRQIQFSADIVTFVFLDIFKQKLQSHFVWVTATFALRQ
jgi:hypothetical protein